MKRANSPAFLVLVFTSVVFGYAAETPPSDARPETNDPHVYPWSESSEFARVPKSFLSQIDLPSVEIKNHETRQFALADDFVQIFRVTPSEVNLVTTALVNALHEYRMTESKHLEPIDEAPDMGRPMPPRDRPPPREQFHFRLTPFPEEAQAIRRKLGNSILTVLGEQRSKFFWASAELRLESEMSTFAQPVPLGMARTIFYTFILRDGEPAPTIDLIKMTRDLHADGVSGGGTTGAHSPSEALDQYAPEKMKPVLARWREIIANATGIVATTEVTVLSDGGKKERAGLHDVTASDQQRHPDTAQSSVASTAPKWDDAVRFADLPKRLIGSQRIPCLTQEGDVSPEAATLFGLSVKEQAAIRALYAEMKIRFEQVERAHFELVDPTQFKFVLRAFPEKSAALKNEWAERLKELVGTERGTLLDESIRASTTAPMRFFLFGRGEPPGPNIPGPGPRMFGAPGPGWLSRGTAEMTLDVTFEAGPAGQPTQRIEFQTEGGGRGSSSGPRGQVPERWQHLLTPDLLRLPEAL